MTVGRLCNMHLREWNGSKLAAFKPVHRRRVDGNGFLGADVRAILEVAVLALLLGLEVETGETPKVLLDDGLVDGGTAADTLTVIVRDGAPPIGLALDVPQNDVLDGGRHTRDLPGN